MRALPLLAGGAALAALATGALLWRRRAAPPVVLVPPPSGPKPPSPKPGTPPTYRVTPAGLVAAIGRSAWRRVTLPTGWSVEVMQLPAFALMSGRPLYLPADYATALAAARETGASLMSPGVMDAVHAAADSKLKPCILPPTAQMASLEWAQRHSACVEAQHPVGLASNAGKGWVRGLRLRSDQAANHGWYDSTAPNGVMWQRLGRRHNRQHVDYSQTVQLMRAARDASNLPRDISAVLKSPDFGMLGGVEREAPDDLIS